LVVWGFGNLGFFGMYLSVRGDWLGVVFVGFGVVGGFYGLKSFGFWFLDTDCIIENLLKSMVICMKRAMN
jgi:hypothetical protein